MTDADKIESAVRGIAAHLLHHGPAKDAKAGALYVVEATALNVGRIADALERIADKIAPEKPTEPKRDFFGAPKE